MWLEKVGHRVNAFVLRAGFRGRFRMVIRLLVWVAMLFVCLGVVPGLPAAAATLGFDDPPAARDPDHDLGDGQKLNIEELQILIDGYRFSAKLQFDMAIQRFGELIKRHPQFAEAYRKRGQAYRRKGEFQHALKDYSQAIGLRPGRSEYYYDRAECFRQSGNAQGAVADYTKAIELSPSNYQALADRGALYTALGKHEQSNADISRAISLLSERKKLPESAPEWERAAEQAAVESAKSTLALCMFERSILFSSMGKQEDAIRELNRLIKLEPTKPEYQLLLADQYRETGDVAHADAEIERIIKQFPKSPEPYVNRAIRHEAALDYPHAIEELNKAIELDPKNAFDLAFRGYCHAYEGNLNQAAADADAAVRLDTAGESGHLFRAIVRTAQKDYQGALNDWDAAIRANPSDATAHGGRARLLATCPDAKFRDAKAALASAMRACELSGWDDPVCLDSLAAAHAEAGDFGAAIEWETKSLSVTKESDPDRPGRERYLNLYQQHIPVRESTLRQILFPGRPPVL